MAYINFLLSWIGNSILFNVSQSHATIESLVCYQIYIYIDIDIDMCIYIYIYMYVCIYIYIVRSLSCYVAMLKVAIALVLSKPRPGSNALLHVNPNCVTNLVRLVKSAGFDSVQFGSFQYTISECHLASLSKRV